MCGSKKIDGYTFCLGVDSFKDFYIARPDLQGLIRPVTYLIREAIFRPSYLIGTSGRSSLDTCSLGELMDMYHAHKATKRHDKVYALLGMSSDDLSNVDLLPSYEVPWDKLLQRLAKYLLSEKISVETWWDKEIAIIKNKGCILGKVTSIQSERARDDRQGVDRARDDRQGVDVILKNILGQSGGKGEWSAHWTLQVSAKSIQEGDLICLLQGALKPTIIRLCEDHFIIIIIGVTPLEDIQTGSGYTKWPNFSPSEQLLTRERQLFTRHFVLVWGWDDPLEKLTYQERYETLIETNNSVSEHSKTKLEGCIDKATRIWNVALILGDLEGYGKAEEMLREAVEGYKMVFGEKDSYTLSSQYGQTPLVWAARNGYDAIVSLLLTKYGIDVDLEDSQYRRTPLSWAAEGGHENVVKLLLETDDVDVDLKGGQYGERPL
jgi:hypothetical protein